MLSKYHLSTRTSDWVIRGVLTLIIATLGYFSVAQTIGYAVRRNDAARAFTLAPRDGRIVALFAQQTIGARPTVEDWVYANALAHRALLQDPTAVPAVVTLGVIRQMRGDLNQARRLFAYAQRLTRRDLQVQVWAIEDAVGRNDITGALRHYDIALRTSARAPDLLFPILSSAIGNPAIRTALRHTLVARPPWAPAFMEFAAVNNTDPIATAHLYLELHQAGVPVSQAIDAKIIATLMSRNKIDAAWLYYAGLHSGVSRSFSRQADFVGSPDEPSLFDWAPVSDSGINTFIAKQERGGSFEIAVAASVGGALLQQMQVLPPGSYRIEGRSSGINQPATSQPYWSLTCRDGRELGRINLPASLENKGRFYGRFDVPPGCPVQVLLLVARPSDAIGGLSGSIRNVSLSPIR